MGALFLFGSLFGALALLVPVALVLGLVVLLALRGEPDDGARGLTLYLAMAAFLGFFTLLIGVTALSAAVTELVAGEDEPSFSSDFDFGASGESFEESGSEVEVLTPGQFESFSGGQSQDDRTWTSIIQTLIAIAAALIVLRFHWPRLEAIGTRSVAGSAASKVRQAYCYTICFLEVVVLLVSASVATFTIVQAIAPGTTGAANRGDPIEAFVPLFVLGVGSAALFRIHWSRVDMPAFLRPTPPPGEVVV